MAQQVPLTLSSGSTTPGSNMALAVSLTASGGAAPTGLQWTMSYPAVVTSVSVTANQKSIVCSSAAGSTTCLLFALDTNVLGNGVVATATVTISAGTTSTTVPITVSAVVASDASGNSIPASGGGGTITVIQPTLVTPSSISCSPSSVNAPGTSACTVTLSGTAPSGGLAMTLSSNNANATVLGNVSVAGGAITAGFMATVVLVTSDQIAVLTANANGTSQTFSLSLVAPRRTISGTVTPVTAGNVATVTLSGAGSAVATADSSGNFSFSGLLNGSFMVAPSKSGFMFTPASQSVSVNGANITGVNFAAVQTYGSPTVDTQVSKDQSSATSKVTSPAFTTSVGNELLLALVAADYKSGTNTSVKSISGAGLTWVLIVRTRTQKGTSEIWRAFATAALSNASVTATLSQSVVSSITVVSFTGVDTSGANGSGAIGATASKSAASGAPTATLVTTRNNSWVLGVGNDYDNAIPRTPGVGQNLVHQYLAPVGDTYWVQSQSSPIALSGTSVTMNDSAPTSDAYNYSISEILGEAVATGTQVLKATFVRSAPPAAQTVAQSQVPALSPAANSVTMSSAATGVQGKTCSPGGLVTILGTGFTGQEAQSATSYPLPTKLAGMQVMINGNAMPLVFASTSQINLQCPLLPQGSLLEITVVNGNGVRLPPVHSTMLAAAPDLFTLSGANTNGANQGVILITSTNELAMRKTTGTASRPAQPGENLTIYATGLGETQDIVPLGTPASSNPPILLKNEITVVVGGTKIDSQRPTLAPGTVGLDQINAQLPDGTPVGPAVSLYIQVTTPDGTVVRSNTVTLAIGGGAQ
jgi:uncharacterized protein (TIGR03437 family)